MRNSDRAWLALAAGVAAYDLIATDEERLSDAARRYFKSRPVATTSMILMTALHLIGGIPQWCDPFALLFAAYRRLRLLRLWPHDGVAEQDAISGSDARSQVIAA